MFKFRDNKQLVGTLLGAVCFLPSFIIAWMVGIVTNLVIGIIVMIISQFLWLTSIELCMSNLERENRELKNKINDECK